jgi:spore coat polysaccharide biosynthesis protein SpsF
MGSKRLPGKSMKNLYGKPLLYYVIQRVKKSTTLDVIVLAIPNTTENDVLENLAKKLGIKVFRGSEDDVLSRYVNAARIYRADIIVRVSADNPLTAPEEIDRIVAHHLKTNADYSFNGVPQMDNNYPDGLGAEVMKFSVLEKIDKLAKEPRYREHVTPYLWDHYNTFHIETIQATPEIAGSDIKLDIDTMEDFRHLESLIKALPYDPEVLWPAKEIIKTYRKHFNIEI